MKHAMTLTFDNSGCRRLSLANYSYTVAVAIMYRPDCNEGLSPYKCVLLGKSILNIMFVCIQCTLSLPVNFNIEAHTRN